MPLTRLRLTAVVAAVTLVVGFAVADLTGVRALGGVVLVLGCGWCAWVWWRERGVAVAIGLTVVFLAAFAVSHPLAKAIGAWPSVIAVSLVVGGITYGVTRATRGPRTRTATPVG